MALIHLVGASVGLGANIHHMFRIFLSVEVQSVSRKFPLRCDLGLNSEPIEWDPTVILKTTRSPSLRYVEELYLLLCQSLSSLSFILSTAFVVHKTGFTYWYCSLL